MFIEGEFFGTEEPVAATDRRSGKARRMLAEERLDHIVEKLIPLLERTNRMMIRNLKAMAELRRGPNVAIGRAEQVNVAQSQINVATRGMDE